MARKVEKGYKDGGGSLDQHAGFFGVNLKRWIGRDWGWNLGVSFFHTAW